MSTYIGKSIVDATPEKFNERNHGNERCVICSSNVGFPAGTNALVISNWRHLGEHTPMPVFDIAVDVGFGIRNWKVSWGYPDKDGNWHWSISVSAKIGGNDIVINAATWTSPLHRSVSGLHLKTVPACTWWVSAEIFTPPFSSMVSPITGDESLPLSHDFSW